VVAGVVAALTLFSGFGLGTLLMPAFAVFFPLPAAIAATAVVHLANNVFKVVLVGRKASWPVVLRFGLPATVAAIAGAELLATTAAVPPLASYTLGGETHVVTPLKVGVGLFMVGFALLELLPRFRGLAFDRRWLAVGGLASGFFGGFTGHQGALRSAFLVRAGLDPQAFIGTGVVAAVLVDVARLCVYVRGFSAARFGDLPPGLAVPLVAATAAAFLGSFLGARLLGRVTSRAVQRVVGGLLVVVALGLGTGLL